MNIPDILLTIVEYIIMFFMVSSYCLFQYYIFIIYKECKKKPVFCIATIDTSNLNSSSIYHNKKTNILDFDNKKYFKRPRYIFSINGKVGILKELLAAFNLSIIVVSFLLIALINIFSFILNMSYTVSWSSGNLNEMISIIVCIISIQIITFFKFSSLDNLYKNDGFILSKNLLYKH